MTHRERVLTALARQPPDSVPYDCWAEQPVYERLGQALGVVSREDVLGKLDVDLRVIAGPRYVGPDLRRHDDGSVEDVWGVPRKPVAVRGRTTWTYRHVARPPLAHMTSLAEIEGYPNWPTPDLWDYSNVARDCAALREAGYAVVYAGDRLDRTAQLKTLMYLRGVEQAYLDLAANSALAQCILEHVVNYYLQHNRRMFAAARGNLDIFMMGDDFGTQEGPMFSLKTWRRLLRPGFRAYVDTAHEFGIRVMHHTCGDVRPLIPDLIECGLDILQSLQPRAGMDLRQLKRQYGDALCFHGSIDVQHTLPFGTPHDVRAEVAQRMEAGARQGGVILCTAHNIPPETPVGNVLALFDAYRELGGRR